MRYRGFQCQRAGVVETDSHRLERIGRGRVHRQKAVTPQWAELLRPGSSPDSDDESDD